MDAVQQASRADRALNTANRRRALSRRDVIAAVGGGAVLGLTGCRGAAITTVAPEPIASFPGLGNPPLLVDAGWLQERLSETDAAPVVLLDLSNLATYREGHVPGALHAWWQDWIDPYSDIYGVLLGTRNVPSARVDGLRRLGIDLDSLVVAYDAEQNRYAARMVWILRYFGLRQSAVLDGGLGAWRGAGFPTSRDPSSPRSASPAELTIDPSWTIPFEEMTERFADPALKLIDVRTDDEADDDLNGLLHRGTIPGAARIPWRSSLRDPAGRLRPPDELVAVYADAGILVADEVGIVARFGVEAAHTWLVLTLLGYTRVRLFDRGWAHWGRKDLEMPIAGLDP